MWNMLKFLSSFYLLQGRRRRLWKCLSSGKSMRCKRSLDYLLRIFFKYFSQFLPRQNSNRSYKSNRSRPWFPDRRRKAKFYEILILEPYSGTRANINRYSNLFKKNIAHFWPSIEWSKWRSNKNCRMVGFSWLYKIWASSEIHVRI